MDDEHIIRAGLQSLDWPSIGVRVIAVADNGINAMQEVHKTMPDIVLSDVKMPVMSGIELAHKVKKLNPNCIFIFFSGYSEFSLVKAALVAEAFDYILKPSDPQEIFGCIKRATEKIHSVDVRFEKTESPPSREKHHVFEIDEFMVVKSEQAAKIIEYIKHNYTGECSLQKASDSLNYTPVHINRILKKNTKHTFHELLMTIRMFISKDYLVNTQLPIMDISEKVGISDQRYFSQVFKKTFGVSPSSYRAAHGDGNEKNLL